MYYPVIPETHIFAPENPWLEDEISFWGQAYVSFRDFSVRMFGVAYIFYRRFLTPNYGVSDFPRYFESLGANCCCQKDGAGDAQDETQEMIQEDILEQCFKICTPFEQWKNPGYFAVYCTGWKTTQVYRDYNKPWNKDPY